MSPPRFCLADDSRTDANPPQSQSRDCRGSTTEPRPGSCPDGTFPNPHQNANTKIRPCQARRASRKRSASHPSHEEPTARAARKSILRPPRHRARSTRSATERNAQLARSTTSARGRTIRDSPPQTLVPACGYRGECTAALTGGCSAFAPTTSDARLPLGLGTDAPPRTRGPHPAMGRHRHHSTGSFARPLTINSPA